MRSVPWQLVSERVEVVVEVELLDAVIGPIWAALGAIGHKALSRSEDQAADETVQLGLRLLSRLRRRGSEKSARPQLEAAATVAAADPEDEDFRLALRGQLKMALMGKDGVEDPTLAADLASLLELAGVRITATGTGSVVVSHNEGIVSTGDRATNTIRRGGV